MNNSKAEINSKIIVKESGKPGPSIAVMVGVHGDELCCVKALDSILPKIKIIAGRVTFIYANLEAIKQKKRFIDFDLNRCFFSDQPPYMIRSVEGRTTKELVKILEEADALLDVHASTSKKTTPFIICEKNSYGLVKCFPFKYVCSGFDDSHPGDSEGFMNRVGKRGIGIECGYLGDKKSIEVAKDAIITFLTKTGSIKGKKPQDSAKEFLHTMIIFKNRAPIFKLAREFPDFEELPTRTIIGFDGEEKIFGERGDFLLFAKNADAPNKECFVILRRTPKE